MYDLASPVDLVFRTGSSGHEAFGRGGSNGPSVAETGVSLSQEKIRYDVDNDHTDYEPAIDKPMNADYLWTQVGFDQLAGQLHRARNMPDTMSFRAAYSRDGGTDFY